MALSLWVETHLDHFTGFHICYVPSVCLVLGIHCGDLLNVKGLWFLVSGCPEFQP